MPDWLASLWEAFKASGLAEVFKNPDGSWNWERIGDVLKGAGGALGAVVAGTFAFYKFRAEQRKKADEKKGGATNVTHSGPGPASGRDTRIGGNLVYGADGRQVGEAVAEATGPLLDRLVDRVERLSAEKAGLSTQLDAARQALAEAIAATETQAEAGQPRAAEALALLAAGKIAEAIALFEAEAKEKKAASRVSAKEAAAAYRHLGAIAGLADPKRA